MENNDRTTIELALKLINENNKIVLSSISKDYKSKNNFYKLSDVDISPGLKKDLDDGPSVDELLAIVEGRMNPASLSPTPSNVPREIKKSKPTGLIGNIQSKLMDLQAKAIVHTYKDKLGLSDEVMKSLSKAERKARIQKALNMIKNMSYEERAKFMDVDIVSNERMPSSNIYNPNIGRK